MFFFAFARRDPAPSARRWRGIVGLSKCSCRRLVSTLNFFDKGIDVVISSRSVQNGLSQSGIQTLAEQIGLRLPMRE